VARMLEVDEIMSILRTTMDRLIRLTGDALPAELKPVPYTATTWSIAAVVAHLRACNDVLGGAMLRILREDHPSWRATSPRTWQARSRYHDEAFEPSLAALAAGREDLLVALEAAPLEAWDRTAMVSVPPKQRLERSVRYYGDWLAQHERTHLKDLERRRAAAGVV
jgi:hypothetical protein